MDPDIEAFDVGLAKDGYGQIETRSRPAGDVAAEHSHGYDVQALGGIVVLHLGVNLGIVARSSSPSSLNLSVRRHTGSGACCRSGGRPDPSCALLVPFVSGNSGTGPDQARP